MEEMKKFLRFVVPGLVVVVEFSGILFLLLLFQKPTLLKYYLTKIIEYGEGIGISFSLLLLSGGLGALLATIYHYLLSLFDKCNVNYSELLKYCENKKYLKLYRWNNESKPISHDNLHRLGQWRVLTAFWHINKQTKSEFFKEAERRAETLYDIGHGLGTQLIGSILVLGMLFLFDLSHPDLCFGLLYLIPVLLIMLHFFAFKKVIHSIQSILSNFFINEFVRQKEEPYIIYVSKKDLKWKSRKIV